MQENKKVYQLTFEAYDDLIEKFKTLNTPTYYPPLEYIDRMQENPEKWLIYACYLLECGEKPKNKKEEYKKKNLTMFINEHLELVDDESEIANPLKIRPELQDENM